MKLNELLKGLTVLAATADMDTDITDVCYDSRQTAEGGLFVAIAGAETDGHRFLPMARPVLSASMHPTATFPT